MLKVCVKCKETKVESEFNSRYGKFQSYCASCSRFASREHYLANKQNYVDRSLKRTKELVAWVRELKKDLKCERCGENHPATLDFHHKDPNTKEGSVSNLASGRRFSKERILEEISKCEVICSNCHRKEHYTE